MSADGNTPSMGGPDSANPTAVKWLIVGHQSCSTCRWWVEWTGEDYLDGKMSKRMGNCVRKSPRILTTCDRSGNERFRTKWPNTAADQFCGDHKPAVIPANKQPLSQ